MPTWLASKGSRWVGSYAPAVTQQRNLIGSSRYTGSSISAAADIICNMLISSTQSGPVKPYRHLIFILWAHRLHLCYVRAICRHQINWHQLAHYNLQSTMQQGSPETGDDKFEDVVHASKLIPFLMAGLDTHRCALPSRRELSSLVHQKQTQVKARSKPCRIPASLHLSI